MKTVYTPPAIHRCRPGWVALSDGSLVTSWERPLAGTILECECGLTWVAYYWVKPHGGYMDLSPKWKLEGRFARRRRERKSN